MRAILSFSLPEDTVEHRDALQGSEAKRVIWEIDQRCRSIIKHGDPSEETRALAEEIRMIIRESPENLLDD